MIVEKNFCGSKMDDFRYEYNVPNGTRNIIVAVTANYRGKFSERSALISYRFRDSGGSHAYSDHVYKWSSFVGEFFYLDLTESGGDKTPPTVEILTVPAGAQSLLLEGRNWRAGIDARFHDLYILALPDAGLDPELIEQLPQAIAKLVPDTYRQPFVRRALNRGPAEPGNSLKDSRWAVDKEIVGAPRGMEAGKDAFRTNGAKRADKYRVALVCDEFTYNSFAPEFDHVILEPSNWREKIEEFQPDLFLCESAWSGVDSKRRPWRGQVYSSIRFPYENRNKLLEILAYCRERSIPTVFWNKEDPTHFHDRVNDFVDTASRFDYVLTTAEEMLEEYEKFIPKGRVGVLPFAAQPRQFNPLTSNQRKSSAIFAGAWYDVHPHRSEAMKEGFDWVLEGHLDLEIYDRNFNVGSPGSSFPEEYASFVRPPVSHKATAGLYKSATVGLNFNTVVDSRTMFARRVFELAASGTLVVSNYSPGIEDIYGDDVVFYDRTDSSGFDLTNEEIHKRAKSALRTTFLGHTYRHRFEQILDHVGLPFSSRRSAPTMLVVVASDLEAQEAIRAFQARRNEYSRLLIVVASSVPSSTATRYMIDYGSRSVDVLSLELLKKENVPSSNFLSTGDVILTDPRNVISRKDLDAIMLHGEYTRHPTRVGREYRMTAGRVGPGTRLSAVDVIPALIAPDSIRPLVEVER